MGMTWGQVPPPLSGEVQLFNQQVPPHMQVEYYNMRKVVVQWVSQTLKVSCPVVSCKMCMLAEKHPWNLRCGGAGAVHHMGSCPVSLTDVPKQSHLAGRGSPGSILSSRQLFAQFQLPGLRHQGPETGNPDPVFYSCPPGLGRAAGAARKDGCTSSHLYKLAQPKKSLSYKPPCCSPHLNDTSPIVS